MNSMFQFNVILSILFECIITLNQPQLSLNNIKISTEQLTRDPVILKLHNSRIQLSVIMNGGRIELASDRFSDDLLDQWILMSVVFNKNAIVVQGN